MEIDWSGLRGEARGGNAHAYYACTQICCRADAGAGQVAVAVALLRTRARRSNSNSNCNSSRNSRDRDREGQDDPCCQVLPRS